MIWQISCVLQMSVDCFYLKIGANYRLVGWGHDDFHGDPLPLSHDQFPLEIDFSKKIISDRNPSTLSNICLFQPPVSIFVTLLAFLETAVHPCLMTRLFHFSTEKAKSKILLCLFWSHLSKPIPWNLSRIKTGANEWEVKREDGKKEKVYKLTLSLVLRHH